MGRALPPLTLAVVALLVAALAGAARVDDRPVVVRGCDGLYYEGEGRPDAIVVSDLPFESITYTAMTQMTQAIKLTLKDDGFRAGRLSVGYVSCDDSGPSGSWSSARCRANARAAARTPGVLGVIGTLDSGCALAELPILARAELVLVSPLNTAVALTRPHRAAVARLSAPDDAQADAAARFVRSAGARTVAVLSDGTQRGNAYRGAFAAAARRRGLRVLARGRADAAYVGGLLSNRSAGTLRAARRRAGSGPLVLCAGYGPAAQLAAAAPAVSDGAYLVVAGMPGDRLGSAGRKFVRHFESSVGGAPHPYAVYAAEAARVLLGAIGTSNGTRHDVAAHVLATRDPDGLTGPVSFDRNGDPRTAAVTIFRVDRGRMQIVKVLNSAVP